MRLTLTTRQREMLTDIASVEDDGPCHPTLHAIIYDRGGFHGFVLDLPEPEWVQAIGDCLTYHEGTAANNLLEKASEAAESPAEFRRECLIAAGLAEADDEPATEEDDINQLFANVTKAEDNLASFQKLRASLFPPDGNPTESNA